MSFRKYDSQINVENTYKKMLQNHTLKYLKDMKIKFNPTKKCNIWDIIKKFNSIIDESDPDSDLPQIVHAYQTAESIKNKFLNNDFTLKNIEIKTLFSKDEWFNLPEKYKTEYETTLNNYYSSIKCWDWLYLVGFIHDLGKIMLCDDFGGLPQWSVVGDTFPLGQKLDKSYIYEKNNFHYANNDLLTDTYKELCGFESLKMNWGHDEYLATILERNSCEIPKQGIYIIRFHSFYSWHTPPNNISRGYEKLASNYDWYMLPLLKLFQKSDLYSKTRDIPVENEIINNLTPLIKKYSCEELLW
jgi:inositol oxygenase